jgi:hypothetical protein
MMIVLFHCCKVHYSEFVSIPPIQEEGSSSSHRARLSSNEIGAIIFTYQDLPEEDKQTHIVIWSPASDFDIEVVLGMLAGESSELA